VGWLLFLQEQKSNHHHHQVTKWCSYHVPIKMSTGVDNNQRPAQCSEMWLNVTKCDHSLPMSMPHTLNIFYKFTYFYDFLIFIQRFWKTKVQKKFCGKMFHGDIFKKGDGVGNPSLKISTHLYNNQLPFDLLKVEGGRVSTPS
jgi:hypothetical protein